MGYTIKSLILIAFAWFISRNADTTRFITLMSLFWIGWGLSEIANAISNLNKNEK